MTYCDRYQKLAAKFAGLHCTADLGTGVIGAGALSVETIRLIKDANGTTDLSNLN